VAAKAARLSKEFKFGYCMGRQLQVWFLGVLHREFIYRDERYNHSRLSKLEEDDDYFFVSDIEVFNDFTVTLEKAHATLALSSSGQ
jgi:hypothetical protein